MGSGTGTGVKLRDGRRGGWFWAQNELLDVFLPLVGPQGVLVYMAMCRLVPMRDGWVPLQVCGEAAGVSKSTAQRMIVKLVALAMLGETRGKSRQVSRFDLPDLKDAAAVGLAELQRRLSISERDSKMPKLPMAAAKSQKASVPERDSTPETAQVEEKAVFGTELSQNRPKKGDFWDSPLNRKRRDTNTNPPTPQGGFGRVRGERRETARSRQRRERAQVGAPGAAFVGSHADGGGPGERPGGMKVRGPGEVLSSADIRDAVRQSLEKVRFDLAGAVRELGDLGVETMAEWDAALSGVGYEGHETAEGAGLLVRIASSAPELTVREFAKYAHRIEPTLRRVLGCAVLLQVQAVEGEAA